MSSFYSFLPYVRQGLSSRLINNDVITGTYAYKRPRLELKLNLNAYPVSGSPAASTVTRAFELKSPGDIEGINTQAIVKVFPAAGVTNLEPNYLPYVEFYDEDFCWRYTPAKPRKDGAATVLQYRLRPWLALVVLKDDEYEVFTASNGKPAIRTLKSPTAIFPTQESLWAWAHTHVNENLSANESAIGNTAARIATAVTKLKNDILPNTPDKVVSRLLSPRRLEPDTRYTGFLIPVFESGRRAGLGLDATAPQMLAGAWTASTPIGTEYPVYYSWAFKTGMGGDFESLARLLKPSVQDEEAGRRPVGLLKSNHPELEAVIPPVIEIAMRGIVGVPGSTDEPWPMADATNAYAAKIREIVNRPTVILEETGLADPVIAPPIYGRWLAARDKVAAVGSADPDWLQEVNLDPRFRMFAGAGAETVRRNQEKYMEIAWQQVGELDEANRKLRLIQLTKQVGKSVFKKHIEPLNNPLTVNLSAPVHQRIKNTPATATIFKDINSSALPVTMLSGTFRRITGPGSPLISGYALSGGGISVSTVDLITEVSSGAVVTAGPYLAPVGMSSYSIWSDTELTASFTLSLAGSAGFVLGHPGVVVGSSTPGVPSALASAMLGSIASLHGVIEVMPTYHFPSYPALSLATAGNIIKVRTEPYNNMLHLAKKYIKLKSVTGTDVTLTDTNLVMAAPKIKIPLYEELARLSPEWIMPGLNDLGMNSITVLEVNRKYLEAYMLGVNTEMNRELLWRGYPTDQRGTSFSFFWGYANSIANISGIEVANRVFNLNDYRDIHDIHRWRVTPTNPTSALKKLGANDARTSGPSMTVIAVRGELLRKYPDTLVYLHKAKWLSSTQPRQVDPAASPIYPVFTAKIEADIYLLGFNVDPALLRGGGLDTPSQPGYFFIFQERAGALKFGADETNIPITGTIPAVPNWKSISWAHIKNVPNTDGFINVARNFSVTSNPDAVVWNWNGGTVAYALYQAPYKLNVHAEALLPEDLP